MRDASMIVLTPAALMIGALVGSIRNRLEWLRAVGFQAPGLLRIVLMY
jgi:hypothetical protein